MRSPYERRLSEGFYLSRSASGEKLEELIGLLAKVAVNHPGIYPRTTLPKKARTTRVDLISDQEILMQANRWKLERSSYKVGAFFTKLHKEFPKLADPRDATAVRLEVHEDSESGGSYFVVSFDEKSGHLLGNERADSWHVLEDMLGHSALAWEEHDPGMCVAYVAGYVPEKVVNALGVVIRNYLPMPTELASAIPDNIL